MTDMIIRDQAEMFKVLTETSLDGFLQIDMQGGIIDANETYSHMTGYTLEELKTLTLKDLEAAENPEETARHIKQLAAMGSDIFESRHRGKNGEIIDVEISVSYWKARNQIIAYVRDITLKKEEARELQQMRDNLKQKIARRTEELRIALDSAKEANSAKSRFLSRISHELRTPLNAIIGFARLMTSDNTSSLSSNQRDNLNEIITAGDKLLALIERILEFSASHSALHTRPAETVACLPIIKECLEAMKEDIEQRNLSIILEADESCSLRTDRGRLKQVLLSLISNAVKYNSPGGSVMVRAAPGDPPGFMRLTIEDTGRGIPAADRDRIFEPFERLESQYDAAAGIGIGLVLAKRLVEEMGGSIGVENREEKGSSFWIELPMGEDE